jgi:hypothetical protein
MTHPILQTRIATEPATTERLTAILRAADRRGTAHLPEPEALVAATALNNTGFFNRRYGNPIQAGRRAAEVVPDDWLTLALDHQASHPRTPVGRLSRLTNPARGRFWEPAITLHRGGRLLKATFSEHHLDPIPLPEANQMRDEAAPGWLAIGALAGLLGLDFPGRRLFEVKHGAVSEVFLDDILPWLEMGKWLGFVPSEQQAYAGLISELQAASIGRHKDKEDAR